MKHIKKFNESDAFSMYRENCDRCGRSTNNNTIMSIFNQDIICMNCKKEEEKDPEFKAAQEAEFNAVRSGITDYKGAIPNYKPLPKR